MVQCWTRTAKDGHKYITCSEKELEKKKRREDADAKLLLSRFATPVGQEEPSVFTPPQPAVKGKPYKLKSYHKKAGWIVQYGARFPDVPYYFNTKTGETRWSPPEERSIPLEVRMSRIASKMMNEQYD